MSSPPSTAAPPRQSGTEPERRVALLTADAILRNIERGDWRHIVALTRSLLRTATDALRVENGGRS